jgi:hypothetical protein
MKKKRDDLERERSKWFSTKPQNVKGRLANAPHWTHAGTIAARRKALDELHTNRQWNDEMKANRLTDKVESITSELHRLRSMRDMRGAGNEFYAGRYDDLRGVLTQDKATIRALRQRPARP